MFNKGKFSEKYMSKIMNNNVLLRNYNVNIRSKNGENNDFRIVNEEEIEKYKILINDENYYKMNMFDKKKSYYYEKYKIEEYGDKIKKRNESMKHYSDYDAFCRYIYKEMGYDTYLFVKTGIIKERNLLCILTWNPVGLDIRNVVEFYFNLITGWVGENIVKNDLQNLVKDGWLVKRNGDDKNYELEFIVDLKGGRDLTIESKNGIIIDVEVSEDRTGYAWRKGMTILRERKLEKLLDERRNKILYLAIPHYNNDRITIICMNNVVAIDYNDKNKEEKIERIKKDKEMYSELHYILYRSVEKFGKHFYEIMNLNDFKDYSGI